METTSTTTDILTRDEQVRAGVTAHALISLGLHLSRHTTTLAPPLGVELPDDRYTPSDRLIIHVPLHALAAWIDSVTVTRDGTADDEHRVDALLPDSGLRVQIFALRPSTQVVAL